ncbi:MAG: glycosyltransferase family 2 protein [Desulfobulbaceae bacterium]|nr:glycosyltransferase family 2 protein [Desulfobulbaceae bacterium]
MVLSVIIPTCNAANWLDEQLTRLSSQSLPPDEILVVDSASTDDTRAIACNFPLVRFIEIEKEAFDHGGTRSMAARQCRGDILVFFTQDAMPANKHCLALLTEPLRQEGRVAVSYGRQLPHADAAPFAAHLRLFNYPAAYEAPRCFADRKRMGLHTIFCSNSFAAYKKEALIAVDFFPEQLLFGEDTFTVAKIVELGYCVQYMHKAQVFHSHNYTIMDEVKRYFDIGAFHAAAPELLSTYGGVGGAGRRFVIAELKYLYAHKLLQLVPLSLARTALKLLAYNLGRQAQYLPLPLRRSLSMRPSWWQ